MGLFDQMREEFKKIEKDTHKVGPGSSKTSNIENKPQSQLLKNHMNPTPNGLDGQEENKNASETPNPM